MDIDTIKQKTKDKINSHLTKEKMKEDIKEIVDTIFFVLIALVVIRFFVFEPRIIPSGSMHPTLIEKDRLIIERFSRFYSDPVRGDIIVFYPPHEELKQDWLSIIERLTGLFCKDIAYIKRVIGTPGDTVEVKMEEDGSYGVYVNGEKLDEPYIQSKYEYPICTEEMFCKITLKENEYFVMGDNRGNSFDSRYWGTVDKKMIVGINKIRFWPLNRLAYFKKVNY